MKKYFKNITVNAINLLGITLLFLFAMLFASILIVNEYQGYKEESKLLRQNYFNTQEQKAKNETERVLSYITHFYDKMHTQMDEEKLKESIISSIEYLFDRKNGSSYIFIYTKEGVNVADPNKPYNKGKNLLAFQDPNGKYVIKELIEEAKNGGGYVQYMWDNPLTKSPSLKTSYAMMFEPLSWMIGTGVYLDEIDKIIEKNNIKYKNRVYALIVKMFALALVLFIFAYFVIRFISNTLLKEITVFRDFFKKAVTDTIYIDKEQIRIKEFQTLVGYVNEMVSAIHERNDELQELNASLEEKVAIKTAKLQKQTEYNAHLVSAQDSFIKHSIHEINTPLAVILTHLDIYKMKYGQNEYLSKIEAGAKMISNIYDDLGYMVKKDRIDYVKRSIAFGAFIEDRIAFFEEIAKGNGYSIVFSKENDCEIDFNDLELQRIVDNNLSNAIKYAKRRTDIHVRLSKEDTEAVLSFVTESKKIEDTAKIFERFHREEFYEEGFGLGLEIVGAICKKENVRIEVSSDEKITVFCYRFTLKEFDESSVA